MATKKDLVEAHAFSRRRLVTAFLSGAPGGREVEPSRPGRTIVAGAALALLVVATGAILAVLVGRTQEGWDEQPGLVNVKETSHLYAVLTGTKDGGKLDFRPVVNPTSGQLLFGDQERLTISQDTIADYRPGDRIGIADAPEELPEPDALIPTGWTSCVDRDQHMSTEVAEQPHVRPLADTGAFLVADQSDDVYLVARSPADGDQPAQARRYLVTKGGEVDTMLGGLGVTTPYLAAQHVPDSWIELLPQGGALDLTGFDTTLFGQPVPGAGTGGIPAGTRYGDYVEAGDEAPDQIFVFWERGVTELDPFASAVYANARPAKGYQPRKRFGRDVGGNDTPGVVLAQDDYPTDGIEEEAGPFWCLQLDTSPTEPAVVGLVGSPSGDAAPQTTQVQEPQRFVQPDHGAVVLVGGSATQAPPSSRVVVDEDGNAYPVVGDDTLKNLGYDGTVPTVPTPWVRLFAQTADPPVILSKSRALCSPDAAPNERCGLG